MAVLQSRSWPSRAGQQPHGKNAGLFRKDQLWLGTVALIMAAPLWLWGTLRLPPSVRRSNAAGAQRCLPRAIRLIPAWSHERHFCRSQILARPSQRGAACLDRGRGAAAWAALNGDHPQDRGTRKCDCRGYGVDRGAPRQPVIAPWASLLWAKIGDSSARIFRTA